MTSPPRPPLTVVGRGPLLTLPSLPWKTSLSPVVAVTGHTLGSMPGLGQGDLVSRPWTADHGTVPDGVTYVRQSPEAQEAFGSVCCRETLILDSSPRSVRNKCLSVITPRPAVCRTLR